MKTETTCPFCNEEGYTKNHNFEPNGSDGAVTPPYDEQELVKCTHCSSAFWIKKLTKVVSRKAILLNNGKYSNQ